ncbi:MAG TPA: biotin/lipoyl-binding carrier protein [Candidatus Nanopelagicales bacterium]|nr:biotin/lipoyl-binding carrier protein [Candidatus Nanopelagicales bacterium]
MAHTLSAEMVASVHSIEVSVGQRVDSGAVLVVLESMKMEIPVLAEAGGLVTEVYVGAGDVVREGDALVTVE